MGGHDAKTAVIHGGCHGQSLFQKSPLSELLKSLGNLDKSSLDKGNAYQAQGMRKQLEDYKASKVEKSHEVEGLILHIKEIKKEHNQ